jgi:hypothetical protein
MTSIVWGGVTGLEGGWWLVILANGEHPGGGEEGGAIGVSRRTWHAGPSSVRQQHGLQWTCV